MEKIWIVSHPQGAQEFLAEAGIIGICCNIYVATSMLQHLCIDDITVGDIVIGALPLYSISHLCDRAIEYWHHNLRPSVCDRGQALSAKQLKMCGACLERYDVQRILHNV